MVLAPGRLEIGCLTGVVDTGLSTAGGDKADVRLKGLRTGMAEWLDTLLRLRAGVGGSLRCGEGVVKDKGLKL
jgi:hypothetical protein